MPEAVLESADQAIDALQNGHRLPPKMFGSLSGNLAGIDEIRLPYDDDTYRVYLYQGCPWVVMVMDAGIKKSNQGRGIPKWQAERLEQRLSVAKRYCAENEAELNRAYAVRMANRIEAFSIAGRVMSRKESRR